MQKTETGCTVRLENNNIYALFKLAFNYFIYLKNNDFDKRHMYRLASFIGYT